MKCSICNDDNYSRALSYKTDGRGFCLYCKEYTKAIPETEDDRVFLSVLDEPDEWPSYIMGKLK